MKTKCREWINIQKPEAGWAVGEPDTIPLEHKVMQLWTGLGREKEGKDLHIAHHVEDSLAL
jgi:hypothetical protein